MQRIAPLRSLVAVLPVALFASCASWSGVRFVPSPLEVQVAPDAGAEALGSALFAWRGIHETDDGYEARFRVRLRNDGPGPLELVAARTQLVDGGLRAFFPPRVEWVEGGGADAAAPAAPRVEAGTFGTWDLAFGFDGPPEDAELDALHLTLALEDAESGIQVSASFERLVPVRDSGWGGSFVYGWGWHARRGPDFGVSLTHVRGS